jgi:hypothetical protein
MGAKLITSTSDAVGLHYLFFPFEPVIVGSSENDIQVYFTQAYVTDMLDKTQRKVPIPIQNMGENNTYTIGLSGQKEFFVKVKLNTDGLITEATFTDEDANSQHSKLKVGYSGSYTGDTAELTEAVFKIMKWEGGSITEFYFRDNIQWWMEKFEQQGGGDDAGQVIITSDTIGPHAKIRFKEIRRKKEDDNLIEVSNEGDAVELYVSGSGKSTAIVKAHWSKKGYVALYCVESPEVRFEDVVEIERPKGKRTWTIQTCPRFKATCAQGSLNVVGYSTDKQCSLGFSIDEDARLTIKSSILPWKRPNKIVVKISGIRAGFRGIRMQEKTKEQYLGNEEFLNLASKFAKEK